MATQLIRPYKMSANTWQAKINSEITDENGRNLITVAIGEILEGNSVQKIYEVFYKDILISVLKNGSPYKTTITLGKSPQLTITCDGNIVLHNPEMLNIKKKIINALNYVPQDIVYDAFIELRLNKEKIEKRGKSINLLMGYLGRDNTNYPVELVCAVLIEYLCTDKRSMENDTQDEIRELDYETFVKLSAQVFEREQTKEKSETSDLLKEYEEQTSFENIAYYVKEEAYVRLLQGYLREGE